MAKSKELSQLASVLTVDTGQVTLDAKFAATAGTAQTDFITKSQLEVAVAGKDNTDEITEGTTNLYYTSTRANADFDTRLATKSTSNLAEGTNLYYTSTRANADFDTRLATKSTTNLAEGTNLYFTDARAQSAISGTSPSLTNLTLSGYLRGPANFTIDPSAHGDNTGTVIIAGNLQVDGTTTTVNSTTVTVNDLNIVLANNAANASQANGAGITINGASASLTYVSSIDSWSFNKSVDIGTFAIGYNPKGDSFNYNGTLYAHYGMTAETSTVGLSGYYGLGLFTGGTLRLKIDGSTGYINTSSRITTTASAESDNYSGVLRISPAAGQQWGGISFPDSNGSTSNANNYWFYGRGTNISDRTLTAHIPSYSDYSSTGAIPSWGVYRTGAFNLFTVLATGNVGINNSGPAQRLTVNTPRRFDSGTNSLATGGIIAGSSSDTPSNSFTSSAPIFRIHATDQSNNLQFGIGLSNYSYASWIQSSYDNSSSYGGVDNGPSNLVLQPLGGAVVINGTGTAAGDNKLVVYGNTYINGHSNFIVESAASNHTRIHAAGDTYGGASPLILSTDRPPVGDSWLVRGIADYNGNEGGSKYTFKIGFDGSGTFGYADGATGTGLNVYTRLAGTTLYNGTANYGNWGGLLFHSTSNMSGSSRRWLITNSLHVNKLAFIRSTDATTDPSVGYSGGSVGTVTSGVADLVIDPSGRVGLGTTDPNSKLTITDTSGGPAVYIASPTSTTAGNIGFSVHVRNSTTDNSAHIAGIGFSSAPGVDWAIGKYWNGSGSSYFDIRNGASALGAAFVRIDTGGNVGIGSTPTAKLAVYGNSSDNQSSDATFLVSCDGNNDWGAIIDKGVSSDYGLNIRVAPSAAYALRVTANNAEALRVGGNGNLSAAGIVNSAGNTVAYRYEKILSGTYNSGTWYPIFNPNAEAYDNGIYLISVYVDTYNTGGGNYSMEYVSVPFKWHNHGTNNGDRVTLPTLYGIGHAPNGVGAPTFSLQWHYWSDSTYPGAVTIEMMPPVTWSGLDSSGGKTVKVYLRKIG